MKNMIKFILALTLVLMMCGGAMAQGSFYPQGNALVPNLISFYLGSTDWATPAIMLTNITDNNVKCKVVIYDSDANEMTNRCQVRTGGGSSWTIIASGVNEFDIPAHSSRMYCITTGGSNFVTTGHAEIEWQSDDTKARKALIGGVATQYKAYGTSLSNTTFLINNGQPF